MPYFLPTPYSSLFSGLNVFSMLKHESLILTLAAVEKLEKKLLDHMYNPHPNVKYKRF